MATAEAAERLLAAANPYPRLQQTAAVLMWHAKLASGLTSPVAVGARIGEQLIGYAGVSVRHASIGTTRHRFVIISFVATHPAFRRRGVSGQLHDALLGGLASCGLPVLAFRIAGGDGARHNEAHYLRNGYQGVAYSVLPTFGATSATLLRADSSWRGGTIRNIARCLIPEPGPELARGLLLDSRGCAGIGGEMHGTARVVKAVAETSQGTTALLLLEDLHPNPDGAIDLTALGKEALAVFPDHGRTVVVTACPESVITASQGIYRRLPGPPWHAWLHWPSRATFSVQPAETTLSVV